MPKYGRPKYKTYSDKVPWYYKKSVAGPVVKALNWLTREAVNGGRGMLGNFVSNVTRSKHLGHLTRHLIPKAPKYMKPWRAYDGQVLGSNPPSHRFTSNTVVGSNPRKDPTYSNPGPGAPIQGDRPNVPRKPARMLMGRRHHLKYARRRKFFTFK
jgi:hypothetical protein